MELLEIDAIPPQDGVAADLRQLFAAQLDNRSNFSFGVVTFEPGVRVPPKGVGVHDGDEYSIVNKGTIRVCSGGKETIVTAGHACFIPAGEHHWAQSENNEDCEIVWLLINP